MTRAGSRNRGLAVDEVEAVERARLWLPVGDEAALADLSAVGRALVAVAREVGAPTDDALSLAAEWATARARVDAELDRVVRPAVSIARGLVALPMAVVPALAAVLDLDLVAFVTRDPLGPVVLALVVAMVGLAVTWMWAAVRRAVRPPTMAGAPGPPLGAAAVLLVGVAAGQPMAGVVCGGLVLWWARRRAVEGPGGDGLAPQDVAVATQLCAVALHVGVAVPAALRAAGAHHPDPVAASTCRRLALHLDLQLVDPAPAQGASRPGATERLRLACVDLVRTGRPGAPPLRRLGLRLLEEDLDARRLAVARLPAQLTFPTALLLVPATVLALGAPIAVRGLTLLTG